MSGAKKAGLEPDTWNSMSDMLLDCHAEYLTGGLESLRSIPSGSVDFIFSQAVLEHVRRKEFEPIFREFYRLLRPDGYSSHVIDWKDHLGYSLNSLRFPDSVWEGNWFANSGFYTNRLRHGEITKLAEQVGFTVETLDTVTWPQLPIAKSRFQPEYQKMDDDELRISSFKAAFVPGVREGLPV
jgi:SAM-dependent methyltransferase